MGSFLRATEVETVMPFSKNKTHLKTSARIQALQRGIIIVSKPVKRKLKEQLGWRITSEIQWCTMLGPVLFSVFICLENKICNE